MGISAVPLIRQAPFQFNGTTAGCFRASLKLLMIDCSREPSRLSWVSIRSFFSFEGKWTCNLATSRLPSQRPALRSEMVTACSSTRIEKVGFCNAMFVCPLA